MRARSEFGPGTARSEIEGLDDKLSQIYAVLQNLLEGEAFVIIRNTEKGNGLEGWRKLNRRYDPATGAKKSSLLRHILTPGSWVKRLNNGWPADSENPCPMISRCEEEDPYVVTGCPPCGPFSALQGLNEGRVDPVKRRQRLDEGKQLLKIACEFYEKQIERARYFLREHPSSVRSWNEDGIEKISAKLGEFRGVNALDDTGPSPEEDAHLEVCVEDFAPSNEQ